MTFFLKGMGLRFTQQRTLAIGFQGKILYGSAGKIPLVINRSPSQEPAVTAV